MYSSVLRANGPENKGGFRKLGGKERENGHLNQMGVTRQGPV